MNVRSPARRDAVWHLKAARVSLRIGCPSSALSELERLLADERIKGRYTPTAIRLASDAAMQLRRLDLASHYASLGYLLWPDRCSFAVRLARIAMSRGQHVVALHVAQGLVHEEPGRFDAKYILAQAHDSLDRPADALAMYEELLRARAGSRDVSIRIAAARAALRCDQPERGLRVLSSLVRPPRELCARLLHRAGRLAEALDLYNQILADNGVPDFESVVEPANLLAHAANADIPEVELDEHELLAIAIDRIDVLDRLGRLRTLLEMARWERDVPSEDPRLRVRVAEALVKYGQAREAMRLIWRDRHHREVRWQVVSILLACAEVLDRPFLADRCASMLSRKHRHLVMAAQRHALAGSIMARSLSHRLKDNRLSSSDSLRHHQSAMDRAPGEFELLVRHAHSSLQAARSTTCGRDTSIPPRPDPGLHIRECEAVIAELTRRRQSCVTS